MKSLLLFLSVLLCLHSQAQQLTSGGKLKPEQAIMDVRHYTIALDLDLEKKSIAGYTIIDVNMLQPARVLLFDLMDSFNIRQVLVNNKKQNFGYAHNMITINLSEELAAGKASIKIVYDGQPHIARRPPWDDGFTWTKDPAGNPWIAITAEGGGGKLYYPCKDHPSDEPNEGAELIITVPKGLVVAGPGLLQKTTIKKDKVTYDWKTNYSINNYSILFNVGKFKVVSKEYSTVNGNKVPMQFYVLEANESKAAHHLEILEQTIRSREKYFGEYPWAKEKIAICETPHLGMEHQTMNAYGNKFKYEKIGGQDFDGLMDHEFGHEWWGNKITAKDWGDYWIHEGINTFGDMLDIRELEGEASYVRRFKENALRFENKTPIVQGKDIDEETAYVGDIYGKGAFFMHTLRFVIGDSIFFPALKEFATSPQYTYDNLTSTEDIEQFFSKKSGKNLVPLFDLFLRSTKKLEVYVRQTQNEAYVISLTNLDMTVPLRVVTDKGEQTIMASKKALLVKSKSLPVIDPDKYYLTKITIE
jgi:aminopeptidase N